MNKHARMQFWLELCTDFMCILLSNLASFVIFRFVIKRIIDYPADAWFGFVILFIVSFLFSFFAFHQSIDIHQRSRKKEFIALFKNITLTYMFLIALLTLLKNEILDSRYLLVSGYVASLALSTASRYFLKRYITGFFKKSKIASLVGIITTSNIAESFVKEIQSDWTMKISGIALMDESFGMDKPKFESINGISVISSDNSFMNWIRSTALDEVYINLPQTDSTTVHEIVEELEDMGITVHINIPTLEKFLDESKFNNINCKMIAGYPMATFSASINSSSWLIIKRIFDVVFSLIAGIISIPIIIIVAIPLLIESKGPLFFSQDRIGKNGRKFKIYKIRSMYADAEERKAELADENKIDGLMFKVDNDPRITKVGKFIRKFSIDELPQFFNVIKGDMSLIGTRPPTVDEFEQYESHHKRRLSMRPGITGMWQVSGRSNIQDFEEVVKLDCQYIDEWSPLLDLKIFFKTIGVVLTHKGAE